MEICDYLVLKQLGGSDEQYGELRRILGEVLVLDRPPSLGNEREDAEGADAGSTGEGARGRIHVAPYRPAASPAQGAGGEPREADAQKKGDEPDGEPADGAKQPSADSPPRNLPRVAAACGNRSGPSPPRSIGSPATNRPTAVGAWTIIRPSARMPRVPETAPPAMRSRARRWDCCPFWRPDRPTAQWTLQATHRGGPSLSDRQAKA